MKRILITGAGGFTARHLISYLQSLKSYQIFAGYHKRRPFISGVTPVAISLNSFSGLQKTLEKIRPDYICHLAAQTNARLSWQKINQTFETNVFGTLNLARAILQTAPKARLLYTSSVHVYGKSLRGKKPVSEKNRLWPENPYAMSKALSELSCLDLYQRSGLQVIIVRTNNLLGIGQDSDFVLSNWSQQIARIEKHIQSPQIQVGNILLRRDFLAVEDAVRAYECLLRKAKAGEIYNLASGKTRKLSAYLNFLCRQTRIKIKIQTDSQRFRKDDPKEIKIDVRKLRKLGWKPQKDIFESLYQLLNDWRETL